MALTAELYELRKVLRCDRGGKFERMQCDDNGCFCVDIDSGDEISGTRTTDSLPNCTERPVRTNSNEIRTDVVHAAVRIRVLRCTEPVPAWGAIHFASGRRGDVQL
ncbi:thyroglobulin type-1 repeat-containing domain protein [Teladorsagia circumcincta]|uniref:Thyroglobulin type-1 repeat-containing domain protein n=1 Tax=Teladorsagia circumcincta TaxID=45464 RepID=A0A2G9U9I4_TELCI|nr:thyroglobulin type-1 repeat-containing domain protein [Teladorsagia circumcincta]